MSAVGVLEAVLVDYTDMMTLSTLEVEAGAINIISTPFHADVFTELTELNNSIISRNFYNISPYLFDYLLSLRTLTVLHSVKSHHLTRD